MRDEEAHTTASSVTNGATVKKEASDGGILGRGKYKFWALAAILLLAFWSMFTGSVTLKWSTGNLKPVSDDFDTRIPKDLDVLEVEEKEKLVKHMWDVYTQSRSIKLPTFWQEAFKAAYEDLTSEVPSIRNTALSEIAKMFLVRSTLTHELEPPLLSPALEHPGMKEDSQAGWALGRSSSAVHMAVAYMNNRFE